MSSRLTNVECTPVKKCCVMSAHKLAHWQLSCLLL